MLPHHGERGENNEERVRKFLGKVLPKKFSVGTGFIVCSDPKIPTSSQTDVVIYDEFHNSPLHRELAAYVYPAGIVYGTVEVKGKLRSGDLRQVFDDVQKIRGLAEHRWYVHYGGVAKDSTRPTELVTAAQEFQIAGPPSRTFLFAFSQDGWRTIDALVESLKTMSKEIPSHIHGYCGNFPQPAHAMVHRYNSVLRRIVVSSPNTHRETTVTSRIMLATAVFFNYLTAFVVSGESAIINQESRLAPR
ncbi:MAG TPA: DUF6602 domain-containing protein [Burkholderiales bacterium]|nr:DUF6602 domain-containing protein [Burkholderiales bacterium]